MSEKSAIVWSELTVGVQSLFARNVKIILNNISGEFAFNSINALMGSSGSGKTTLLKCLNANNKYIFSQNSNILIPKDIKITKCFIHQNHEKRIMTGLTVKQGLTYASKLKNSTESGVNHNEIVSLVMSELLISDVEDNLIEKCSGGQIKRYCIAAELTAIKKPNILFLDEPTTGLDSNAAEVLIGCMKQLCRLHRMSIITSIHQPNNELFLMFDSVYVLARGGICVFSGVPQNLRQHLNECDIKCTENQIPIEVLIKLSFNGLSDENVIKLNDKTKPSMNCIETNDMTSMKSGLTSKTMSFSLSDTSNILKRLLYLEFSSLLKTLVIFVAMTFLISKGFSDKISEIDGCFEPNSTSNQTCIEEEDQKSILSQNQTYLSLSTFVSIIFFSVIITDSYGRALKSFHTEYENCWYSVGTFYLARYIFDSIVLVLFGTSFVLIMVFHEDPDSWIKIGLLAQICLITYLCSQYLVIILTTIFNKSLSLAVFMVLLAITILVVYCNFYFMIKDTDPFTQILSEFDFFKYFYNSALILIYGFGRCPNGQESRVLIEFDLEEDQDLFWKYYQWSHLYFAVLFVLHFIIFWIKAKNVSINIRIFSKHINPIQPNKCFDAINVNSEHLNHTLSEEINDNLKKEIQIAWFNLTLNINKTSLLATKHIKILDDISGCFEINSLNAIMGPSGAGKTTFLNCLKGPDISNLTESSKFLFHQNKNTKICFIVQDIYEHLLRGLTVRQTLLYASKLKNSRITKPLDHNQIVSDLMSELLISDTADNRVESCSGGEQKRIVMACELTSHIKPKFLLIDEPTSGLDSNAAEVVINCLHRLSRSHQMTVITSIHQPNQDLFQMFDLVYVLAKGGVCVYSGPPQSLRQHLKECQIECNENQIPIEVLLKVCSEDKPNENVSKLCLRTNETVEELEEKCLTQNMRPISESQLQYKRFSFKDFSLLLKRIFLYTYVSNWKQFVFQFIIYQLMIFSMCVHYSPAIIGPNGCQEFELGGGCQQTLEELRDDTMIKQNVKYHVGLINFSLNAVFIFTCISFTTEFKITLNEKTNGWYSAGAFIWAKSIVDLIWFFLAQIGFSWIINNYRTFSMYILYFSLWTVCIFCTQSIAQITAMLFSKNLGMALGICVGIQTGFIILSNNLYLAKELHYSLQILSEFCHIRMLWECIILAIYNVCESNEFSTVLYAYDLNGDEFWPNVFRLVIITIFWKFVSILVYCLKSSSITKVNKEIDSISDQDTKQSHLLVL